MVVRVDGKDYVVKRPHGSHADVLLANGSTHTYHRQYRLSTGQVLTDESRPTWMKTRVQGLVTKLNAGQERAQPPFARLTL